MRIAPTTKVILTFAGKVKLTCTAMYAMACGVTLIILSKFATVGQVRLSPRRHLARTLGTMSWFSLISTEVGDVNINLKA
jgi:hypothetical protein